MVISRYLLLIYISIFIIGSNISHASPVTYSEISDGDLPHKANTPEYLVFSIGNNVISGVIKTSFPNEKIGLQTDKDDISFIIPEGMYLKSIKFSIDFGKGESRGIALSFDLYSSTNGTNTLLGFEPITVPSQHVTLFQKFLPLHKGNYTLINGKFEHYFINIKKHYQSYNYRWVFEVSAIDSEQAYAWNMLESAQEDYKNGNYEKALKDATPLAKQGISAAQTLLGNMYERGRGVAKDYGIAIEWYMKAYKQGDVSAEYWLNLLHNKATPLSCNSKLVEKILLPLAIEGYPPAMNSLCVDYTMGLCQLPQDFLLARAWCEKAAHHGLPSAKNMLDQTIPEMENHAVQRQNEIKQYERKASLGDLDAHIKLGMMHFYGDTIQGVTKDYTKAAQWFRMPAENGNTEAQIYLGMVYQEQGNLEEAEKWYRIPAESGNARAQLNLAMLYIEQDKMSEALELIKSSAQKNYSMAQYILGSIYEDGVESIPQDYVKSYMWYWLACTDTDLECDTIPLFSGPESLSKKMTESEIAKAKDMANKWLRQYKQNMK
mgnify:FL=1